MKEACRFVTSERGYKSALAIVAALVLLLLASGHVGAGLTGVGGFALWTAARVAGYLIAERVQRGRR